MNEQPQIWILEIKNHIADGNLDTAIKYFLNVTSSHAIYKDIHSQVILISLQYNDFKRSEIKSIVPVYDNSVNVSASKLLDLLSEIENNLSKETGHYVDEISELRKAFIMAKSNYELEKIHFDSKRLVQKYPHSFEAQKLHDLISSSIIIVMPNLEPHPTKVIKVERYTNSFSFIAIILIIIIILIYFLFLK